MNTVKQHLTARAKVILVLVALYTVYHVFTYSGRKPTSEYLGDGPSTKGYGIVRGGTGNLGYGKDKRTGGLPPSARRIFEDKDPSVYDDYAVANYDLKQTEVFNKDKNKVVIVVGANVEGGVNRWKGPSEWSTEKLSIQNKKKYAQLHGYDIVVKDYTKAKKYSDDHREGWQKFDLIKQVMDEYSSGDWFWYLDLHTLIMEPDVRIEDLVFEELNSLMVRNLASFNPNGLVTDIPYTSPDDPVNLILSQDCGGFNLHSFLIKKTSWTMLLFDTLFDPVIYLKEHKKWTNGEKHALEYYYDKFAWIRSHIGFIPSKLISALAKDACPQLKYPDQKFFYNETTRDFLVDMEGCEFNRNCFDEMQYYMSISENLHKSWISKLLHI